MSNAKTVIGLLLLIAVLWGLYPPRQLGRSRVRDDSIVEIKFMGPGGPIQGALAQVIGAFERESRRAHEVDPAKPIYRVISGQNAAKDQVADPTRFLLSVAGDVPPDVIWFDRYAVAEWAARHAFEPLDDYIQGDRQAGLTDYPQKDRYYWACWNEAVYRGHVYGIPVSTDDRVMYYNADLLVKAGLVDSQGRASPPRTWKQLKEYAVRLSEWSVPKPLAPAGWDFWKDYAFQLRLLRTGGAVGAGGTGGALEAKPDGALTETQKRYAEQLVTWFSQRKLKRVGFAPQYGNSWLYMYGWMNGGRFMTGDDTCTLNDPRIVEALRYMKEIYTMLGGYAQVRAFESSFGRKELDPFLLNQVAMKIDGSGTLEFLALHAPTMQFGVAPPPLPEHELAKLSDERLAHDPPLTTSWLGGWALAIPAGARHKQAAWALIRFVSSDRGMRLRTEAQKQIVTAQGKLFLPPQSPVKHLNEEFFRRYVEENNELSPWLKAGVATITALLPYSHHRPVTPVGQLLWNAQKEATEYALYGDDPQQVLDRQTALVQHELDRFYEPPVGHTIESWSWFFWTYGLLIVGVATVVYLWDTNPALRRKLARLMPGVKSVDGVVSGSRGGYFKKQWKEGVICALPWIIGFIIFGGGPMLFSIVMSFCDFDVINPPRFIGLANYRALMHDELLGQSLYNTAFMVLGVPLGLAVSLAIALLLNMKVRGIAVWRTFFYLPSIVPMVAASVLWIWIFNAHNGLLNQWILDPILHPLGLEAPNWLQDTFWSKPAIIIMGLWGAGGGMIIWLAGLKSISPALYEAASVDGANVWQRFVHVTIPQLTPYIFFNLIMGLIGTFQIFGQAFIMTGGGPRNSTLFYVYYLFNNAFRYGKMGYASSMAWVLFVMVLILTIFQLKFSKRWVHYEGE